LLLGFALEKSDFGHDCIAVLSLSADGGGVLRPKNLTMISRYALGFIAAKVFRLAYILSRCLYKAWSINRWAPLAY
jgi:hypothetical protein